MADPTARQYICDCQKYCHGTPTALSQRTYRKHTDARLPIVPFSDFLALQQTSSTAAALSEPALAARKHPRTEHEDDGICIDCESSASKQPRVEQPAEQSQDFFESHLPGATVGDKTGRVTAASPSTPMASPELAAAHVPMNMDEDRTPPSPTPIPHSSSAPVLSISFPDPSDTPSDTIDEDVTDHLTDTVPAGGAHDEAGLDLDLGSLADLHLDDEVAGQPSGDIPEPESWIHIDDREPTLDDIPSAIEDIQIVQDFIKRLQSASLDKDNLPPDAIERLRHPLRDPPDLSDPILRFSICIYLALSNSSQESYNRIRAGFSAFAACLGGFGLPTQELLSYDQVKRRVTELSGVVPITHHMCVNTCLAFTGPFQDLDACPTCSEPRYDQQKSRGQKVKVAQREFHTMPLGPQLQARRRMPDMAENMQYRDRRMDEILAELHETGSVAAYDDLCYSHELLTAKQNGYITSDTTVIHFSIDGAQLYQNKQSDCWMYIWTILDLSPDLRYKKKQILPGGFIPGPNKPKNLDSFLFPGLHHLSALQHEGLHVWDGAKQKEVVDRPFLAYAGADTPAMALISGRVGHLGAAGCRYSCPLKGRRKTGGSQYYPAHLKPLNYTVQGSSHPDIVLQQFTETTDDVAKRYLKNLQYVVASQNPQEYKKRRLETGICKPTIFSGIHVFYRSQILALMPGDLMHLPFLNLPELKIGLWRGTIDCDKHDSRTTWDWMVLKDDVWTAHGKEVGDAISYLPGSFDRPPRNPAEKINSGYKASEFGTYFYGYCPAMLYGILPDKYWRHFCKVVLGIRIIHQHSITPEELALAHKVLIEYAEEFELFYYQRSPFRIHFCRQSIHQLRHVVPESIRVGLLILTSQWPMERMIGDLGMEIRQPSNPFANLSQRGLVRAQVNALHAMVPDLEPEKSSLPQGSVCLGDDFVLLRARDNAARQIGAREADAFTAYLENLKVSQNLNITIPTLQEMCLIKWARLRLPNGQVARSAWKERLKELNKLRTSRNVKVKLDGKWQFCEVQYYFQIKIGKEEITLAMVSVYGPPDPHLFEISSQTVLSCQYYDAAALRVIDVKTISSVVAMIPHKSDPTWVNRFFVVEKLGLKVVCRAGGEEIAQE